MKVTGISIVIGAIATVTKGLKDLEIRGRVDTIQITALLRSAQWTEGNLQSLKLQREKPLKE